MADNKNASVANHKTKLHVASKVRKRLNLDLSEEAYTLLQELAEAEDKNMAEVLRTGLALYGIAHEERQKGRSLGVVQDDRVIKEIVIT
ncbi:MAG: hypothetical protein KME43_05930 [Myxacorys chilensis ATA2-1-KO14]|jgi:hypothetical protein|nr:hypothetical protein [Myxacorys chilensis ATA2-1-KO14]